MIDNDIKKALEWCEQFENNIVFKGNGDKKCALALQMMVVIKHALKNYNRQKAEIERLRKATHDWENCFNRMDSLYRIKCMELKVARTEAIKEFAERFENNLAYMGSEVKQMAGVTFEKTCSNCKYSDSCASNYCDAVWDRAYNIRDGKDCWRPQVEMVGERE